MEAPLILEQHYLGCLSQASYLVGDRAAGVLAVVDPRRDVELYLERARVLGCTIQHVLLTHFHADFLAGHLELARATGAKLHLSAAASAEYPFHALTDGAELQLGAVTVRALATPGHTPESMCFLVLDGARPHAVLTGDTLFNGDVGRPDLMASVGVTSEELARALYRSLNEQLMPLPDEVLVYPGHGAGSACGKNLSSETWSTMGAQRRTNYALQFADEAAFVAAVTAGQPPAPAYFARAATLNKRERPLLDDALARELVPLSYAELQAEVAQGAAVLDTRDKEAYAAGHLRGALWVGLDGQFASWAGAVLDLERPVVLVCDPDREREAALRLGRIGYDGVVGYLADMPGALAGAGDALVGAPRSAPRATAQLLTGAADAPLVLDVRQPGEVAAERVAGSLAIPLGELRARLDEVPRGKPVHVHCRSGYRSLIALSLFEAAGRNDAIDIPGGMLAWTADGCPVVEGARCSG
ncbi:MAG: MBL fold metallo-hydrolase [Planctomycetota bacterium]